MIKKYRVQTAQLTVHTEQLTLLIALCNLMIFGNDKSNNRGRFRKKISLKEVNWRFTLGRKIWENRGAVHFFGLFFCYCNSQTFFTGFKQVITN